MKVFKFTVYIDTSHLSMGIVSTSDIAKPHFFKFAAAVLEEPLINGLTGPSI